MLANRPPNSYDVAQAAGVSQSAVSRAFSPGRSIAKATKEKVLKAAAELGYQPNAIARSMSSARTKAVQKSGLVGVVVTQLENQFFAKIVHTLSLSLQEQGWQILLFSVESEIDVDPALFELTQYQVDGVIVLSALMSQKVAQHCRNLSTPVVVFNRYIKDLDISAVRVDNYAGGRMAADVIVDAKHQYIAHIAGIQEEQTGVDRELGFCERLRERGATLYQREVGDYTFDSGYEATQRLLNMQPRPDAIFCASDLMALGAMHAARTLFGLSIPTDLTIIGFDDVPAAAWPGHQLTTISQPIEEMGQAAVKTLVSEMENPETPASQQVFAGKMVLRSSSLSDLYAQI